MSLTPLEDLPTVLHTERLTLRLADPDNEEDCRRIVSLYTDPNAGIGGNARVGINSIEDVRRKQAVHGAPQKLCTKAVAPKSITHLVFLKLADESEGDFIGQIMMNFRAEMPYPDIGYSLFQPFWGKGYASEAGRAVLRLWMDVVGVKEVFTAALEGNRRSIRCAEGIGFVRCGGINVAFGAAAEDVKTVRAVAFVLPGMQWSGFDKEGRKLMLFPTVGTETEQQKKDALRVN